MYMFSNENNNQTVRNHHDDWPNDDEEISLDIHDLPHRSSNIEWWYCHGHLTDCNSQPYAIFASFFRTFDDHRSTFEQYHYLHALVWGIIDIKNQIYYSSSYLDRTSIDRSLNGTELSQDLDKHLYTAYREVLNRNNIPLPDRLFSKECYVDLKKLYLNYDDNLFFKDKSGNYHLSCYDSHQNLSLKLKMRPVKQPCRQAHHGIANHLSSNESMFYYSISRLECHGQLVIGNQSIDVQGLSWYDHEFGGLIKYSINSKEISYESQEKGWYWFGIQLDNHYEIIFSNVIDSLTHKSIEKSTVILGPDNERFEYYERDLIDIEPLNQWFSVRTGCMYATKWKIQIPTIQCELYLEAAMDEQEFITFIARPSFYEGRLNVSGSFNNQHVHGHAFFECHRTNVKIFKSLDQFFKRISHIVLMKIDSILPRQITSTQALDLIANQQMSYLLNTIDLEIFSKIIISPLRELIDRGGKAWRSFLCLLCIDCVNGRSQIFEDWLAFAEIMHVGSLIIDDIQDQSDIRRGGPTCHRMYGIAQAINVGTAAYFLPLPLLIARTPNLSDQIKLKIYETTFFTLRAAHIGQGLDIHGLDYLMNDSIETGNSLSLEQAIISIHRLKSGLPAGNLAYIGALIGGGTEEQCDRLQEYVQSVGIAFQIIDDVLNLRGFDNKTKQRGEDITAGKITYPIAKVMNAKYLKDQSDRKYVWQILQSKTKDQQVIDRLIDLLEQTNCLHDSISEAKLLVDNAWLKLDPFLSDSFHKIILRAFGLYILERHY